MALKHPPLTETHPELCIEWDYDKNDNLTPDQVSCGSNKKIWWKCSNGHSFVKRPMDRTQGKTAPDYAKCPHCSRKIATPGEYSLATEHPELMEEWDWESNTAKELDPDNLLPRSNQKAHWTCHKCGHRWEARIQGRTTRGYGCPKCAETKRHASKKFQPGINDLETVYPAIAAEWSDRNTVLPKDVHSGSGKEYWWKCSQGHEWKARVNHRTKDKQKCPYCTGKKSNSTNSLAVLYPEIAEEWDHAANHELLGDKSPSDFLPSSSVVAAWQCPDNPAHKYTMRIGHRTEGFGCPFCSHHQVFPEESFAAEYPHLLEEWNWDKNKSLDPWNLVPGSGEIVWWKCSKGHEWKAAINDRVRRGNNCARCQPYGTSYTEQVFFFGAKLLFPDYTVENRYKTDFGREIDVYIPELHLGFEPGSWFWHENKVHNDADKVAECQHHGIKVIVVYEDYPEKQNPLGENHYAFPNSFRSTKHGELFIRDIMRNALSEYFSEDDEIWDDENWHEVARYASTHMQQLGAS